MKTIKLLISLFILVTCIGMASCTDKENENISAIQPGVYSGDIILSTQTGNTDVSRGIQTEMGIFTSTYDQDYIYLHIVNTNGTEKESYYIDLSASCDENNKCFNIQVEKNNNNTHTIQIGGETITLKNGEQVYFSTIESGTWEADIDESNKSNPLPDETTIFQQPTEESDIQNRELLKSVNYSGDELINLIEGDTPYIEMVRRVTGFKMHILFTDTDVNEYEAHSIDYDDWKSLLNVEPEDLKIKIYFGPNFCESFDLLEETGTGEGYYASHNQEYTNFEEVDQAYNNIMSFFKGYGYNTPLTLLSPLNTDIDASEFTVYVCVEYNGNEYYFSVHPQGLTVDTNTVHHIILAFDYHDLIPIVNGTAGTQTQSRTSSGMQKLDIQPFKIICD